MLVSHKYRFIFLRTEKTAGTSLLAALQDVAGDESERASLKRPAWARYSPIHHGALKRNFPQWFGLHPHATARQVRAVLGRKIFDSYFKFAVERNPWDRQVSLYFHREWKKNNSDTDFDRDMRSFLYRNSEYVRLNNWSMYAIDGSIVADRVLRYENLSEEIGRLRADLGIEEKLSMPRMRSYAPDRPHYSTYYSDWTRDLVARWYAREIEALGYEFESAEPLRAASPV
ncbi:MAG: sulfotransferase family 2 domain-containing protein [Alphaproteobacteria bacterium]